ncbi:MAG: tyrosine-type recombinase/integrase [Chloroflexota bacterium]
MDTLTTITAPEITAMGEAANQAAARCVFALYQERRPPNSQRNQRAALDAFTAFLQSLGVQPAGDLYEDPSAWQGITWGTLQAFQLFLVRAGYALGTVNGRVSTVRLYMGLANQAGYIPDGEILRAQGVKGYSRKEAVDLDARRKAEGTPTRKGAKKSQAVTITEDQARQLCALRNDTPQARRDALLMSLLINHGLRVSEIAALTVESFDMEKRMVTFTRFKTGRVSRHRIRGATWQRLTAYLQSDHPGSGGLWLASTKSGALLPGSRMSTRAIGQRVADLGRGMGLDHLSPHDCRHAGATAIADDPKSSLGALMSWGGWESASSASRYIEAGEADNDRVSLGTDE